MGLRYIAISVVCTALSFAGLQFWTETSLVKLKSDGLLAENLIPAANVGHVVDLLLGSYATVALLANFVLNAFILLVLSLKPIEFPMILRLPCFVVWLYHFGDGMARYISTSGYSSNDISYRLVMFQALARDRLERLNASPSATPLTYFRVYSVLLFVFTVDIFWIRLCLMIYNTLGVSMFLLLLFEPFSIGFETLQALLSAIIKRIKGFMKLRKALGALHAALPDATSDELRAYDDECAICREPMAKAKRLHCSHLFHLPCLRSWLDQGLNEVYSCPTCRKPLFVGRTENEAHPRNEETSNDEQLARQISSGLDRQNSSGHTLPTGVFPNQTQNPAEGPWRTAGLDPNWLNTWPSQGVDGAGPSTAIGSVGLGRVQMMMRHLASVGETYAQTALEDGAWSIWPMNPSQATATGQPIPPAGDGRYPVGTRNLHMRSPSRTVNDNIANILAMAETVREVLPHMPDDIIFQGKVGFGNVEGWKRRRKRHEHRGNRECWGCRRQEVGFFVKAQVAMLVMSGEAVNKTTKGVESFKESKSTSWIASRVKS
ncbi:hypothetical protein ACLB2K_075012 [Fragaria x ananassa]